MLSSLRQRLVRTGWTAGVVAAVLMAAYGKSAAYVSGAVVGAPARAFAGTSMPPRRGPFALVLVIDAARPDEIDLNAMPNLARLVAGGASYSRAWVGQLPSITETSHASIGTGVLPSRHLVLGDTWRVPGTNQMAPDLLDARLTRTGYIGKFIRQKGVPDIASIVHRRFPGSVVVAVSGHKIYAADALGAGDADFVAFGSKDTRGHYVPSAIPGHAPGTSILQSAQLDLPAYPRNGIEDTWTTTLTEKFLFKYHPRLMMVNFPEVDAYGHAAGTSATIMQPLMQNVDKQIGRLVAAYGRAGMLSQTTFVITSDHAMIPAVHNVDQALVKQAIQAAHAEALYVGHGTYCPIWLKDVTAVPRVAAALANAHIPNVQATYAKDSAGNYNLVSAASRLPQPALNTAYRDLLKTFESGESPDIVMMYDENSITMNENFVKIGRRGDHGGASWGAQHVPLILAGPGIRPAYKSAYPARLIDIAPTLETVLGAKPENQDGVPLADAMTHPPAWAVRAQAQAAARLGGDVLALEQSTAGQARH
ncbi:MAG: hypothetical protein PVSMB7_10940 [Chloroflexota bacterium]